MEIRKVNNLVQNNIKESDKICIMTSYRPKGWIMFNKQCQRNDGAGGDCPSLDDATVSAQNQKHFSQLHTER